MTRSPLNPKGNDPQSSESEFDAHLDIEMNSVAPSSPPADHISRARPSASSSSPQPHDSDLMDIENTPLLFHRDPPLSPLESDAESSTSVHSESSRAHTPSDLNSDDGLLLAFDEVTDRDVPKTLEEMEQELDNMLVAEDEKTLWEFRNDILTEQDRDNIRAFKLYLISKMPRIAFAHMRHAFRHKMDISSHWAIIHRVAILTNVQPVWYHCCPNSCIAYTEPHSDLTHCPFRECKEPRFTESNQPRRLFCYLPIIPRLQGFFRNPRTIETLSYRHNYKHKPGEISDVFDGEHYRTLCRTKVTVDGKQLPHCYFSGKHDMALGICLDSYLLFGRMRKGPSATPILVENYNIRPEIRTHLPKHMSAGVIPGIPTYDCISESIFDLHAYTIFGMGDILAIEKMLNIKGHNAFCPCRSCKMKGVRNISRGDTIYYIPFVLPDVVSEPRRSWSMTNLPLRKHDDFIDVAARLEDLPTVTARKDLAFHEGIKGLPALRRVGSLDFARSFPWDIMHLFFENIVKNLIDLWRGNFKGLDVGSEDYEIAPEIWEEIWRETSEAVRDIPAQFVRSMTDAPRNFTAESWCFWFVYMAPILLRGRFKQQKYHDHLCNLTNIIKTCIAFTLTTMSGDPPAPDARTTRPTRATAPDTTSPALDWDPQSPEPSPVNTKDPRAIISAVRNILSKAVAAKKNLTKAAYADCFSYLDALDSLLSDGDHIASSLAAFKLRSLVLRLRPTRLPPPRPLAPPHPPPPPPPGPPPPRKNELVVSLDKQDELLSLPGAAIKEKLEAALIATGVPKLGEAKVRGVKVLGRSRLLVATEDEKTSALLRQAASHWTPKLSRSAQLIVPRYLVVVNSVPRTFKPDGPHAAQEIYAHNRGAVADPSVITEIRWLNPKALRDPNKKASSLLITLSDIVSADRCISQMLAIESSLCPTHQYEESPTQCYNCQQYGHTQHQCKEKTPTCARCSVYNRTDSDDGISPLDQHLRTINPLPENHSLAIFGDFNKHHTLWSGPLHPERTANCDSSLLIDVMRTNGLRQCIKAGTPTYYSPVHHTTSTIDLVFITEDTLGHLLEKCVVLPGHGSDHSLISCSFAIPLTHRTPLPPAATSVPPTGTPSLTSSKPTFAFTRSHRPPCARPRT
ncbi:hypothetical protein MVEN_00123100 [Mycena venus]|uniref:CCHC-type domain-containing protein n=1 Tax=Mycena venus TaxID=2733690 RepID=A0A8H6Z821_9AGAR|nr:hypothetical protein MVEN_00123100 [Mycena venus]